MAGEGLREERSEGAADAEVEEGLREEREGGLREDRFAAK